MHLALRLARRAYGDTSPNPMVGAVLVKNGKIIGRGWHRQAGLPHAEIEALGDAQARGHSPRGAILYVTLEPCCTQGRTPPCTASIIAAGIRRVVAGTTDPNPRHAGHGFDILRRAGVHAALIDAAAGPASAKTLSARPSPPSSFRSAREMASRRRLAGACAELNAAFNHWIVRHTPYVTVKAAMTLDGKIATASGESKWITGEKARAIGMQLRRGSDAILVGVNTILADDPALTVRVGQGAGRPAAARPIRRIVLDSLARTPLNAKVICDRQAARTTIVVSRLAPKCKVAALADRVNVLVAPVDRRPPSAGQRPAVDLRWLFQKLGAQNVTSLLVEGGGEVNASCLLGRLAHRVAFFYAPKVLGGRSARSGVAGPGARNWNDVLPLHHLHWRKVGDDLLLTALIDHGGAP
jgi:diaminohydroxyphosphoribosylaminopyrimidine deaminase/5-amino-6-(5-phosphoribosylamino)uracil reductase